MKFRYDNTSEKIIISESSRIEYQQIKVWLTRHVKGYKYTQPYRMGIWNGLKSHFDNGKINLGLWKECFLACKTIQCKFEIENKEEFPINRDITYESVLEFCKIFFKDHKIKNREGKWEPFFPYDYQIKTAYKILKNRYCLTEVATSGGKSLIISIVHFYTLKHINPEAKLLIIVPSINLVTQMYENIMEYNYGLNFIEEYEEKVDFENGKIDEVIKKYPEYSPCDLKIEEVMSDKPRKFKGSDSPNIYVGTYQSLEKWPKDFFKQFWSVVCDEAHKSKAETLTRIMKRTFCYSYNRFGVSGTFPPEDSLEILTIQSLMGPIVTNIGADELVKLGNITPMSIKCVILNHNDLEFGERMSYLKKAGAGKDAYLLEKEYCQNSDKRLEFIKKLVIKCDKNTLLLFHNIEYGQKIFNKLKEEISDKEFYYIDGEINNKTRNEIKSELEKDSQKTKVLIASFGTTSTGISIKNLHYLIMSDSFKSEQVIIQSIGRLLRLFEGKEKAVIFDLVDVFNGSKLNNILYRHYIERKKFYTKRKYPFKENKVNI